MNDEELYELNNEKKNDCVSFVKYKFDKFIKNQKDIPKEYVDIINKNFWDLI